MPGVARWKTRVSEVDGVDTFDIRTLAFNGDHGLGHAEETMEVYRQNGCDILALLETRRDGQNGFTAAGDAVYCGGSGGRAMGAKAQQGVGVAIKESILHGLQKDGQAWECISA